MADRNLVYSYIFRAPQRSKNKNADLLLLSKAEKARFKKLEKGNPLRASVFLAARVKLKKEIARFFKVQPKEIELRSFTEALVYARKHSHKVYFNISHSGDWILVCFSLRSHVGCDLEIFALKRERDFQKLAQRVLAPNELRQWQKLSAARQHKRFYEIWVCKEAYLKMMGLGLAKPMKSIDLAALAHENVVRRSTEKYVISNRSVTFVQVKVPQALKKRAFACICVSKSIITSR